MQDQELSQRSRASAPSIKRPIALFVAFVALSSLAAMVWAQSANRAATIVTGEEINKHIKYLASDELQGRRSGTPGGQLAAEYISAQFKQYGLKTANSATNSNSYAQPFEFIAGSKFGEGNIIKARRQGHPIELKIGEDYSPLNFSISAATNSAMVLAGYGITAPSLNYDDYANLDVKDKIVLVLPFGPGGSDLRGKFGDYLPLRHKAQIARDHGARAILFISEAETLSPDIKGHDNDYSDAGIIAFRISKRAGNELLKGSGETVESLLQRGEADAKTVALPGTLANIKSNVEREMETTSNIIGWLEGNDEKLKSEYIIIGAHYDHLGMGGVESLAEDHTGLHHGADDNASGVAGLLELARTFAGNRDKLRRSIVFIAFSGEEEGLLGSSYYVKQPLFPLDHTVAMLNMDMIGRMKNDTLIVGGAGSSPEWKTLVEELNKTRGFQLKLQDDGYGPSDHSSFYGKDLPVLFFFTGVHDDYHRPSDTSDKINIISEQAIVNYIHDIVAHIDAQNERVAFTKAKGEGERRSMNSSFRVYIGSVPDYAEQADGVKLSGVRPDSPAEKAGIKGGDVIVELAGKSVHNIYDYVYAMQEMKPGETVDMVVLRDGQKVKLKLTPTARQ